ncbi:MAG: DUF3168 domain-containing protein [Pseudomonadota bacterium]
MTYALAWPLQEALFRLICESPACTDHFKGQIFDAPLPFSGEAAPEGLYLILGDDEAQDWSSGTDNGATHVVRLNIHAPRRGFAEAKRAAAALSDAVLSGGLSLSRGRVVNVRFVDARTFRAESDALRRIELRFRFTLEDTA